MPVHIQLCSTGVLKSDSELPPFIPAPKIDGQSLLRGICISPTPGWEESHLHTDQVIKDRNDLSRLSPAVFEGLRFQTNGSHVDAIVRRTVCRAVDMGNKSVGRHGLHIFPFQPP